MGSVTQPAASAKPPQPFWLRWWFIAIVAVVIVGGIGAAARGGNDVEADASEPAPRSPIGEEETDSTPEPVGSVLDSTKTRAGDLREQLEEFVARTSDDIADLTACVEQAHTGLKPFELACRPSSGNDAAAYGLLNLLVYVASGETDAVDVASGECLAALQASHSDELSGWAVQDALDALSESFVVGYPDIDARLQVATDIMTRKAAAVSTVLEAC